MCLDTQHAYAAGDELFSVNYRNNISMVHLNAIPKNVAYGGHLDRHSYTPLVESKNGINFIKKILALIQPSTPIILERMDYNIVIKDIQLLKAMTNEKLVDVDKKTLVKTVQKKRKIFY